MRPNEKVYQAVLMALEDYVILSQFPISFDIQKVRLYIYDLVINYQELRPYNVSNSSNLFLYLIFGVFSYNFLYISIATFLYLELSIFNSSFIIANS